MAVFAFERKKIRRHFRNQRHQAARLRTRRALPAKTLTSKLSKTNSRTMLPRDAPIAIRSAISRRRPLKRTSKRFATLLHAISNTKQTAANSVAKPARIFSVTSCGSVLTDVVGRAVDLVRVMRTVTLFERRKRGAHLFERDARLHSADHAQKAGAAHHAFVRESRKLKRFGRPNLCNRIRAEPWRRHVRQHADDRVRRSVERDAAPDHVRIAAESLLPKTFRDHRDIGALFFLRPKIPAENWTDAKHIEIVRSHSATKNLNRIAYAGECEDERNFLRRIRQKAVCPSR